VTGIAASPSIVTGPRAADCEGIMIARRTLALATLIGLVGALPALADDAVDRAKLRDTLMRIEVASWQDTKTANLPAMADYFADDALLILGDGSRYTKAQFLKSMSALKIDNIVIDKDWDVIVIAPDVATLLYRVSYTSATAAGKVEAFKVASSNTYVRRSGKWLSMFYQETPVK
jgi:uncharacterized protein (TIGR02246 family)